MSIHHTCAVCGVTRADGEATLFRLGARDVTSQESWKIFVHSTASNRGHIHCDTRICSQHFTGDDFDNKMAYDMGYHKALSLRKDAVLTINTTAEVPTRRVRKHVINKLQINLILNKG